MYVTCTITKTILMSLLCLPRSLPITVTLCKANNPEREGNGRQSFQKRTKAFGPGLPSLSASQISALAQSNYLQGHLSQHTVPQLALITTVPNCTLCPYMVLESAKQRNLK